MRDVGKEESVNSEKVEKKKNVYWVTAALW
jgi:hypothetical protein